MGASYDKSVSLKYLAVGQKYRVPKKPNFGKRKKKHPPVVPKGFLFDP